MNIEPLVISLVVMMLITFISAPLHIVARKLSVRQTLTDRTFWAYNISVSMFLGIMISIYG